MKALVDLICKIGIFMIAAQAVIHFAPAQKYAKYMKLVVGIMILLQFLTPIYKITGGMEEDWSSQWSSMEAELDSGLRTVEAAQGNSVTESIISNIEMEIKSKLNNEATDMGCSVIKVDVDIGDSRETDKLDMLRVIVRAHGDDERVKVIEKVTVQKIDIGGDVTKGSDTDFVAADAMDTDEKQEMSNRLRERFCNVLGIEEEYMEVIIYGEVK